ncbi:MAG: aminotransferase class I/II-fold pyridoxal phosphate-dependent enzyme [Clostridia bacterium]|nr:aminotransferase class I/II-fold pyridoxal phosphate-dependent enzyme [Clostridia bacterium]
MDDVVTLGVGEPDFKTPWNYTDAAIYSLRSGHTHYTSNWGLLELRQWIARYQAERFGPEYNPANEILVTVGASEGIDLAVRALVEPGDEVLVPDPSYVSYMPCITFAGGVCVPVPTDMAHAFKLTPEALRAAITPKTKALILPYPNNPTGGIMTKEDYEAIAAVLRDTNIIVIHDEIYAELTYGDVQHVSFAAIPGMWERTITLNGFSKAFAMTGWRLGYAAGPKELMEVLFRIHQYTMLCAPIASQYAGLEALKVGFDTDFADVRRMVSAYDRRRRMLVNGFREAGLDCHEPLGAFYVFPSIRSTGLESEEFCEKLLYSNRVATVPGTAFGKLGEGHIRCSAASSNDNIQTAIDRIKAFLDTLG